MVGQNNKSSKYKTERLVNPNIKTKLFDHINEIGKKHFAENGR